jgi:hypothetical protein
MKNYLLAAAAVVAFSSVAPATAQSGILGQGIQQLLGGGLNGRLATLDNQIRVSFQRGEISRTEAGRLQNELFQLRQLEQSYRSDGLSRFERSDLQQRLRMLERRIQQARFDDNFDNDDRFDDDDRQFGRNGCPPGLAKKNNGCLPPGQAKKNGRFNDRYNNGRFQTDQRFIYRQDGNRVLQIDRRTGQVVRVIDRRR